MQVVVKICIYCHNCNEDTDSTLCDFRTSFSHYGSLGPEVSLVSPHIFGVCVQFFLKFFHTGVHYILLLPVRG